LPGITKVSITSFVWRCEIGIRFKEIPLDTATLIKAIEDSKTETLYVPKGFLKHFASLGYRNLKVLEKEAVNEG